MRRAYAAVAVLLLVLTGCSAGADPAAGPTSTGSAQPSVPPLAERWRSASLAGDYVHGALEAGGHLVVHGSGTLVGLDPDDGTQAWALRRAQFCAVSRPSPTDDLLAVNFATRADGGECRRVGVVDPSSGELLWATRVRDGVEGLTYHPQPLTVGDSTVTAITECCYREAVRFELTTGKRLPTIDPDLTGWDADVTSDGQLVATASSLDHHGNVRFALHDADSGKELWRRDIVEVVEDQAVGGILSADPLIMLTSERGHHGIWRLDERTGRPLVPLGGRFGSLTDSTDVVSLGTHDGALLVAVGNQSPLATGYTGVEAYDTVTGDELWSGVPGGGQLVGLDGEEHLVVLHGAGLVTDRVVLTRHAVRDPEEAELLGSLESTSTTFTAQVGDVLVTQANDELVAYDLPAPGEGAELDPGLLETPPQDSWAAQQVDEARWQDGDVRPGAIDSCHPSDETLALLGFRTDLPPMRGCGWREAQEPRGVERKLDVAYDVMAPVTAEPNRTAVQRARAKLRELAATRPYDGGQVTPPGYTAVRGIGDQAYVSRLDGPGPYGEVHLLVRVRNVIVKVDATGQVDAGEVVGGTVAAYQLERGALAAAEDLLAEAGLTLGATPPAVAPGPRWLADVCERLDPYARNLVTGGRRLPQRAKNDTAGRTGGCFWGTGSDSFVRDNGGRVYSEYVSVTAHAVPDSLIGRRSGEQLATASVTRIRNGHGRFYFENPRPVDGLGDEALLVPAGDATSASQVLVRRGNLLVLVRFNRQASSDLASRDALALDLARAVVPALGA